MAYPNPWEPGWVDQSATPSPHDVGGARAQGTTPQPSYDPNEAWVEMEPLKKVSLAQAWSLIEALRAGGVPVLGSKPRRSGLFSRKLVDLRLSVPARLLQDAKLIVFEQLGAR